MNAQLPATPQPIRLVLADVDGTLVTHEKVLTPRAIEAVAKLRAANILFAITSGRPPKGSSMINDALHLTTPISGFNGGVVVNPDYTFLSGHLLTADVAKQVIRQIREHGLDAWLYTDADWFVTDAKAPHVDREQWTVKFAPIVTSDFDAHLEHVVKIVGVSDQPDVVAKCEKDLQEWGGKKISAERSQPYYLDVTHPHATKGFVAMMLSGMYKIPADHIATIGDMPNDVLMFEKSGMSIAMGNAGEQVQKAATYVTTSCDDEGFANAMEKFVLRVG
jgi:Cof subfamily protein (haloacid dehalogenase superfamily)